MDLSFHIEHIYYLSDLLLGLKQMKTHAINWFSFSLFFDENFLIPEYLFPVTSLLWRIQILTNTETLSLKKFIFLSL